MMFCQPLSLSEEDCIKGLDGGMIQNVLPPPALFSVSYSWGIRKQTCSETEK